MTKIPAFLLCCVAFAACGDAEESPTTAEVPETAAPVEPAAPGPEPAATPSEPQEIGRSITLAGYRGIRIGEAPGGAAQDWGFADNRSYLDECRIWTSEGMPGVYLMVGEDGSGPVVNRITASSNQSASAHTPEGIEVGSTEAEVRAAYSPLEEQLHKYEAPPAKNLYYRPESGDTAFRFEIGEDGRVSAFHVGREPFLSYVEGCS